jgi:hypothetical protein
MSSFHGDNAQAARLQPSDEKGRAPKSTGTTEQRQQTGNGGHNGLTERGWPQRGRRAAWIWRLQGVSFTRLTKKLPARKLDPPVKDSPPRTISR